MIDTTGFVLGESKDLIHMDSSDDNRNIARALAQQAKRSIDIFSYDLDKRVYDDLEFIEAIKQLALSHHRVLIRILIWDSTRVVKDGHRLFNLGQQLTSNIRFHNPSREHSEHQQAFMIADDCGLLHRFQYDRYQGNACFNDPKQAQALQLMFNQAWEHSEPDPHLKRLSI